MKRMPFTAVAPGDILVLDGCHTVGGLPTKVIRNTDGDYELRAPTDARPTEGPFPSGVIPLSIYRPDIPQGFLSKYEKPVRYLFLVVWSECVYSTFGKPGLVVRRISPRSAPRDWVWVENTPDVFWNLLPVAAQVNR